MARARTDDSGAKKCDKKEKIKRKRVRLDAAVSVDIAGEKKLMTNPATPASEAMEHKKNKTKDKRRKKKTKGVTKKSKQKKTKARAKKAKADDSGAKKCDKAGKKKKNQA